MKFKNFNLNRNKILLGLSFMMIFYASSVMYAEMNDGDEDVVIMEETDVPARDQAFNIEEMAVDYVEADGVIKSKLTINNQEDFFLSDIGLEYRLCGLKDKNEGVSSVKNGVSNLRCVHAQVSDKKLNIASKQRKEIVENVVVPSSIIDDEYYLIVEFGGRDGFIYGMFSERVDGLNGVERKVEVSEIQVYNESKYPDNGFGPLMGVTYEKNETPKVKYKLKNLSSTDLNFIPKYEIYRRTFYGEKIKAGEVDADVVTAGTEKEFEFILPVIDEPQSYITKLQLFDTQGNILSYQHEIRYVFHGMSAAFWDIQVTPDVLISNEKAKVRFVVYGSADSLSPGADDVDTPVNESDVRIKITDRKSGDVVGEKTIGLVLGPSGKIVDAMVDVSSDTDDFDVSLELVKDQEVLAEKVLSNVTIEKETEEGDKVDGRWRYVGGGIFGLLIIIALSLWIVRRRNRNKQVENVQKNQQQ